MVRARARACLGAECVLCVSDRSSCSVFAFSRVWAPSVCGTGTDASSPPQKQRVAKAHPGQSGASRASRLDRDSDEEMWDAPAKGAPELVQERAEDREGSLLEEEKRLLEKLMRRKAKLSEKERQV